MDNNGIYRSTSENSERNPRWRFDWMDLLLIVFDLGVIGIVIYYRELILWRIAIILYKAGTTLIIFGFIIIAFALIIAYSKRKRRGGK